MQYGHQARNTIETPLRGGGEAVLHAVAIAIQRPDRRLCAYLPTVNLALILPIEDVMVAQR
jgi:hypothetical protein